MSNFHESAQDIHVEDGHVLKAVLNNVEGEGVEAEFDLNQIIGNVNGEFVWGGESTSFFQGGPDAEKKRRRRRK